MTHIESILAHEVIVPGLGVELDRDALKRYSQRTEEF